MIDKLIIFYWTEWHFVYRIMGMRNCKWIVVMILVVVGTVMGGEEGEVVVVRADAKSRHILNLQVEQVAEVGAELTHSLYGNLSIPDHALETYALPCSGRIRLHVKSAQRVKKGEVLYTLTSPAYADQVVATKNVQANLERSRAEMQVIQVRIGKLAEVGARNSELEAQLSFKLAEVHQLENDLQTSHTRLKSLAMDAQETETDGLPQLIVRAHTDGVVHNVGVTQNSWGEQGEPVITMSDPKAMEIVGSLYAADVPCIGEVRAYLPVGRENVSLKGTWRLAEQVDAATQTRRLFFTPECLPPEARPGQLCRMDVYSTPGTDDTVSIPNSAVVRVGTDDVVFVELKEGEYAVVKVRTGESRRGMTPVHGLHPGQKIVVKGGYELKYNLPQAHDNKKAGHFHADGKFHEGEEHGDHE